MNPLFYPPICITYARGRGGAIWTLFNSHVVLRDCVFQSNVGDAGGALFLQNLCGGLIERCRFESNLMTNDGSAYSCADPDPNCLSTLPLRAGGAIMARGDLVVRDTIFLNNTAANMPAGAVAIFPASSPITTSFRGCTFLGNEGEDRSQVGIFSDYSLLTVSFEECLIAEASPTGPGPVNFFDISLGSQWTATFSDCASEQFLRTSPTTPVFSGTDLIDFEDAASGDLRLAVGSPFRDTALSARSAADASGAPRLRGAGLDLGALEADDPIGDLAGTANTALFLHVGVNGFTAAKPRAHDLVETDLLTIELIAGEGFLYGDAAYLAAEAQAVGQDPVTGPLRLALHAPFFLEEGTNQLAEASLIHAFIVPPGLEGLRLVLQGAAVSPDGTVTFSDAQALHFRAATP